MFCSSQDDQIAMGVEALRAGFVVAFPTDTVYGLGACAYSEEGVERVFAIKGRPLSMALPLLLGDLSQIDEVASVVSGVARSLAKHFWPGPLTLVLPKDPCIPDRVTGSAPTVAVRVPDHPVALALVRSLGHPVTGTSANLSGTPAVRNHWDVREQLGNSVSVVIDGTCPIGMPSTVVDCSQGLPRILREGAIPRVNLEAIWSEMRAS